MMIKGECRYLFILDHFYPYMGGAEKLFWYKIKSLVAQGFSVTVITSQYSDNLKSLEYVDDIQIIRTGSNRFLFQWGAFIHGYKYCKENKKINIQLFGSSFYAVLPVLLLSKLFHIPSTIVVHEIYGKLWFKIKKFPTALLCYIYEKSLYWLKADHYIAVSNYTLYRLQSIAGVNKDRIVLEYPIVDLGLYSPPSADEIHFLRKEFQREDFTIGLYRGRYDKVKGVNLLLQALPVIVANIPNFRLYCIMSLDNKKRKQFEKIIKQLNIENIVVWKDMMEESLLIQYMKACDICIVPSLGEGFGYAAVESATMGKKLICSNVASLPEVVQGSDIRFVQVGSSEELSRGIIEMFRY